MTSSEFAEEVLAFEKLSPSAGIRSDLQTGMIIQALYHVITGQSIRLDDCVPQYGVPPKTKEMSEKQWAGLAAFCKNRYGEKTDN